MGGTILEFYPKDKLAEEVDIPVADVSFPSMTLANNVASPEKIDEVLLEAANAGATLIKPGEMYSGAVIHVTLLILTDTIGRWFGILIFD